MNSLAERVLWLVEQSYGPRHVNRAAGDAGLPERTLSNIVQGKITNPRLATLTKITQHFGVSADWLLTGSGSAPKPLVVPCSKCGCSCASKHGARRTTAVEPEVAYVEGTNYTARPASPLIGDPLPHGNAGGGRSPAALREALRGLL